MQNGHNSRNNGFGRIHHTHHGHSNHHGSRTRDLKLSLNNGKAVTDNSMMRSEEKERQRQEARAQRERSRVNTSAQSDKKEALFAVVQVSPNPSHDRNQISDILGDFAELSKHQKTIDLIGVDHQPATPAPIVNAHLHDPDNYPPPPFYNGPRVHSDHHTYYPHRSQPYGAPGGSRPSKQMAAPPNQYKMPHQPKYAEEVKPSLKSGPGPGPGPGTRSFHDRVPPVNGIPQNEVENAGLGRGRPRSHERAVKDPQIQKIMSEMNDLKSPLSAILQTPRPDHQSSFTFPTPVPVGNKDTSSLSSSSLSSSLLSTSSSSSSSSGFRQPNDPPLIQKSGKSSENRSSNQIEKSLGPNMNDDEIQLSEESEEEEVVAGVRPATKGEPNISSIGQKDPSVSPMKNTDESSNSEDSSGSDSESSSSEEEGKQSPAPASPTPSDKNPWSLSNIFQQSNNKDESLAHETGSTNPFSAAKGNFDSMNEVRPEPMPPSPHSVEPAPPVVTTIPSSNSIKVSKGNPRSFCSPTSTDESSDEESLHTLKGKKSAGRGSRNKIAPSKVTKKTVDPVLSSDSDDEEVITKTKSGIKNLKQTARSPKVPPPLTSSRHQNATRKLPKGKRDSITSEKLKTQTDSESDDVSVGFPSSSSEKCLAKTSSRKSLRQSLKSNAKITQSGDYSLSNFGSPKKLSSSYASQTNVGEETRHKNYSKDVKYNGEAKNSDFVEKGSKGQIKAESHSLKKGRKDEDPKLEKKRRKRRSHHDNDEESERRKCIEGTENEINHRLEDERVKVSSSSRKLSNNNNNNNINNNNSNNSASNSAFIKGLFNINMNPVQWENGVPKLLCSIPLHLIDNIPIPKNVNNNNNSASVKDEKVNKEVLEMRTSGGKGKSSKSNHKNRNSKSPPNEDEKKLRALNSIYKKQRQSSLEPDRIKQEIKNEVIESQDVRSPLPVGSSNSQDIKTEPKSQNKEESKSFKSSLDTSLKRPGSSLSLPSASPHSKKHKKEKRRDRDESSKTPKAQDSDFSRRRKRTTSPEKDLPLKRSRENSRESTRGSSKSGISSAHESKKPKMALEPDKAALSSAESIRDARLSPHLRQLQQQPQQHQHRNVSEERPSSSLSSEAIPPYQPRQKPQLASSQFSQRSGSSHLISPYLDHESEEDMNTSLGTGDGAQRGGHSYSSAREKLSEDSHAANSGDTSEYHSLPSSEHGGSTYRNAEEHSSPPLGLAGEHLYSQIINPSPGPSMEYNKCSSLSQEQSTIVTPRYISYFEKQIPEILKDNTQYLNTAKELKHLADKERHRVLQTIMYLEAVLYFILTGDSMESDPNTYIPSYTMYNDTFKLIRHVSSPIYKSLKDGPHQKQNVILTILSLRCQSLLSLKLFSMKRNEMKEALRVVCDFLKVNLFQGMGRQPTTLPSSTPSASCAGGGTPSGAVWGGSQRSAANNSPSSLSPTPSPAGSVGSEGSQSSSGYSTEGTRQRGQPPPMGATPPQGTPLLSIPPDVHSMLIKHCHLSYSLNSSHEMWSEADDLVYRHDMKDFFIELDHAMGPLTLHASLRELVRYVQTALDKLKKLANTKL